MGRLAKAGYPVRSKVRLLVDPKLDIMGYASEEEGIQHIVIAEWALQSEMLGGLLFHELAHIYHSERRSPSHKFKSTNAIITEFSLREGLNGRRRDTSWRVSTTSRTSWSTTSSSLRWTSPSEERRTSSSPSG